MVYLKDMGVWKVSKKKKRRKKKRTWQESLDYLNDQSLMIKRASREEFMDADIGTRRHKNKKKYTRKPKYKKKWQDEVQEGE